MYSVVLLAALTSGVDAPAFGHRSCHGGCYGSCCGGGCWGGDCTGGYGCCGGGFGGCCGGGVVSYGCCGGGCCGGSCHGHGHHSRRLFGGHHKHGCCGGSCHGGCCGGGYGCCGGGMACYGGCTGGCYGGAYEGVPVAPPVVNPPAGGGRPVMSQAPATIVVSLPAEAKLTIDGSATKSTSAKRVFSTPELTPGQDFYYTFKATVVREGRPITTEQRVRVRAGQETAVRFDFASNGLVKK